MSTRILTGDCRERLKDLPDESVQCVVTSPPYWGLRSYTGEPGMIGLEPTFEEHLANLVDVFREVRRVLRPDGCVFLNYADAYASSPSGSNLKVLGRVWDGGTPWKDKRKFSTVGNGLKPKDLMFMPARVAMALQADGWWVRSKIIWHKPNPMPESVTDRPTSSYEEVFLLTKASRYFYDAEAVRVDSTPGSQERQQYKKGAYPRQDESCDDSGIGSFAERHYGTGDISGANLRNVWTIPTQGFSESHYATFPTKLVETCIKAGTSERGCCGACGAPWERVVDVSHSLRRPNAIMGRIDNGEGSRGGMPQMNKHTTTTGWQPTCQCEADAVPCRVLDPFGGAGTVGLVAQRLGRDSILIEISPEYAEMSRRRINDDMPLFAQIEAESEAELSVCAATDRQAKRSRPAPCRIQ